MFPVEIWGTVSQWVSGTGTLGAALWGVGLYWRNGRDAKRAQARLVRANLAINTDYELSHVVVRNESERHIRRLYFVHEENSLAKSLLRKRYFMIPEISENPVDRFGELTNHIWKTGGPEIVLARRKSEVFGFDRRAGLVLIENGELGAGQERIYTTNVTTHRYRISTNYWLVFQDANGNLWKLELEPKKDLAHPRLKRVKSLDNCVRSQRRMRLRPSMRQRLSSGPTHFYRVAKWLWKNRSEQTQSVPLWDREKS